MLGLRYHSTSVLTSQLPGILQRLKPHEIEDVLCIYKDWLEIGRGLTHKDSAEFGAARRCL